ncbi:MAG TPA: TIGR00725 family protein [Thermomicrobiales bacterium]|nr:TIGR00725 family protein [Thermomicrobiales bacterium]
MIAPSPRATRITVSGPGVGTDEELAAAEAVGRLIAAAGCTLVCGGLGGAMAAACRGAKSAGGVTIGIVPGYDDKAANPWVDHVVCTGLGQARNVLVAATGHALIAVGGNGGTLSEIGLAVRLGRPVVLLGGWAATLGAEAAAPAWEGGQPPIVAATPDEAVERAVTAARGAKG